jgi:predicted membrane protein
MNTAELAVEVRKIGLGLIWGVCTAGGIYGIIHGIGFIMISSGAIGIYTLITIAKEEGRADV